MDLKLPLQIAIISGVLTFSMKYVFESAELFRKIRRWVQSSKTNFPTSVRSIKMKVGRMPSLQGLKRKKRIVGVSTGGSLQPRVEVAQPTAKVYEISEDHNRRKRDKSSELKMLLNYCCGNKPLSLHEVLPFWSHALHQGERVLRFLDIGDDAEGTRQASCSIPIRANATLPSSSGNVTIREATQNVLCSLYLASLLQCSVHHAPNLARIYWYLASLLEGSIYVAPNFPRIYSVYYVEDEHRARDTNHRTEKDVPTENEEADTRHHHRQIKLVAIEQNYSGIPLVEKEEINAWMAVSIVCQGTAALATAEEAFEFEHRNLHIGHIFIKTSKAQLLSYSIGNLAFSIKNFGIQVYITGFSTSRLTVGGNVYYGDFEDTAQSIGANAECSQQQTTWLDKEVVSEIVRSLYCGKASDFHPKTNILWLKHLIECVLKREIQQSNEHYSDASLVNEEIGKRTLESWSEIVLESSSASDFLRKVVVGSSHIVFFLPTL